MRVLVVGLGSMGKRRIRNLRAIGINEIEGVDPRPDRRDEVQQKYSVAAQSDLEAALEKRPDAVVFSTPPNAHVPLAMKALELGIPFFTEAGVPDAGLANLVRVLRDTGKIGVPSSTMRYFPGPKLLTQKIKSGEIGRVFVWTYHSGQYLPDWHPWERIQDYYVGQRETGGCREIVAFELAWLIDAMGPVAAVSGSVAKVSNLPVDIDDVYQLQVVHESNSRGQLTVDVLARHAVRAFRAVGEHGTLEWSAEKQSIRSYSSQSKAWTETALGGGTVEQGYINPEEPYIDEMRDFLGAVSRKQTIPYTFDDELAVQSIVLTAESQRVPSVRQ